VRSKSDPKVWFQPLNQSSLFLGLFLVQKRSKIGDFVSKNVTFLYKIYDFEHPLSQGFGGYIVHLPIGQ